MDDLDAAISELRGRLLRYPEDRYPVQHATTQFHLGVALLNANGSVEEAEAALRTSCRLFHPERLPLEHAKARNMLGVALRTAGNPAEAVDAFAAAAAGFERQDRPLEQAAALYNLGLVQRDTGDPDAAAECFEQSGRLFGERKLPQQASAAARELGATLLAQGALDAATSALEQAVELADQARDRAGLGSAANTLGLTHLAAGNGAQAVEAFRTAVVACPRSVRREGYAMAKANLALAFEQIGDAARARLAARQARDTPDAPEPVRAQASAVLARLGDEPGDLQTVLEQEPVAAWPAVVREELVRWADLGEAERRAELAAWIDGQLARPGSGPDLAEAWLGMLLEMPPDAMQALIRSCLEALGRHEEDAQERFRFQVARAMPRFPVPQFIRLGDTFNHIAEELGQKAAWG